MRQVLSTVIAIALLVGLGALAVLALPGAQVGLNPAPVAVAAAVAVGPNAPEAPMGNGKYNAIALPLDNGITRASELLKDINATTGSTATQALKWDPNVGYTIYDPNDPFSFDFALAVGDPVFVLLEGTGNPVYSMVGDVPAQDSVHFSLVGGSPTCKYNFISIPLDKGTLTLASELVTDIGDVSQVLVWDPTSGFTIYDSTDPFSQDFSVRIGYPYFVCMTASKTWPPTP